MPNPDRRGHASGPAFPIRFNGLPTTTPTRPPNRPGDNPTAYFIALILSSIPGGQAFASSEARYTFCAYARKALTSGV